MVTSMAPCPERTERGNRVCANRERVMQRLFSLFRRPLRVARILCRQKYTPIGVPPSLHIFSLSIVLMARPGIWFLAFETLKNRSLAVGGELTRRSRDFSTASEGLRYPLGRSYLQVRGASVPSFSPSRDLWLKFRTSDLGIRTRELVDTVVPAA